MEKVEIQKFYPEEERKLNKEKIDVFYEKNRVRHADGSRLTLEFVRQKPISKFKQDLIKNSYKQIDEETKK